MTHFVQLAPATQSCGARMVARCVQVEWRGRLAADRQTLGGTEMKLIRHDAMAALLGSALVVWGAYAPAASAMPLPQESTVAQAADEVGDKTEDAKDQTVKVGNEIGDKAEDVKDETVKGSKKAAAAAKKRAHEAADKAEDVKDQTEKGYRTAEKHAKKGAHEVADKAEDVKDESVKGAKKTGNWFKRMWGKVF
jgi:hypothetical protein